MTRPIVVVAVLLALAAAVWGLRSVTMATYRETPEGSLTAVGFEVVTSGSPSEEAAGARALLWPCVADVDSAVIDELTVGTDGRFRLTLQPALDVTETTKFRGCLSDARVAHVRATQVEVQRAR